MIRVKLVVKIKNVGAKLNDPISTYNFITSDVSPDWFLSTFVSPSTVPTAETSCGKLKLTKKRAQQTNHMIFFFNFISSFRTDFGNGTEVA